MTATTEERSLLRASLSPAIGTALSRVTGLGRVVALAWALGQGAVSDGYNLANTAPNLLYELVLGGVLSSTLVPMFVPHQGETQDDADERASVITSVGLVVLTVITVVAVLCSPLFLDLFPSGGEGAATRTSVAEPLLYLLVPQILFYGVTSLGTALLHARRRFAMAAYAPVATNVVTIVAVLAVPLTAGAAGKDLTNRPTLALLGLGTTAGVAAMAFLVAWGVRGSDIRLRWRPRFRDPALREIMRLGSWTIGYVVANQVALLVVLRLASGLDAGAITAYQTAFIFFQLPHGLLAVSIMTSTTPELARAAQAGDGPLLLRRFREGGSMLLAVMIPAAAALMLLGHDLVELVLQRGLFDAEDTARTGGTIVTMALGLPGFSMYLYALRVFYARRDTKTPFLLNAGENLANILFALVLIGSAERGLGLAFSIAYTLAAAGSLYVVSRRVPGILDRTWLPLAGRIAAASATSIVAMVLVQLVGGSSFDDRPFVDVATTGLVGVAAWLAAIVVLRIEGFEPIVDRFRSLAERPTDGPDDRPRRRPPTP